MVCKFADQVYGNDWCPIGKIYCTGGNECGFNHNHQSNADRIRAMSDEELADWLARTQIANIAEALEIAKIPYEQEDGLKDEVKRECLEWLQQPAE